VGAFGTLVGAGGGFILVPVLLFLHPERPPQEITAISLLVVFLNSVSGTAAYARQVRIDYRSALWFALATLPGAVTGALLVGMVPRRMFDGVFAAVLVSVALYLVLRSGVAAIREPVTGRGVVERMIRDRYGNTFFYAFSLPRGIGLSAGIGLLSSLLGIGGGIFFVPAMATLLHFPVHVAVATSQLIVGLIAAEASTVHAITGTLTWNKALGEAGLLALGAIPGAQLGAWLGRRLGGPIISRILALGLIVVGARLAIQAAMG
jgi:uncharacterized protein